MKNKIGILSIMFLLVLGLSVFAYVDYGEGSAQQYGSQGNYLGGAEGKFKGYYVLGSGMTAMTGNAIATTTTKKITTTKTTTATKAVQPAATKLSSDNTKKVFTSGKSYSMKVFPFGSKGVAMSFTKDAKGRNQLVLTEETAGALTWMSMNTMFGTINMDQNSKDNFEVTPVFGGGDSAQFRQKAGLESTKTSSGSQVSVGTKPTTTGKTGNLGTGSEKTSSGSQVSVATKPQTGLSGGKTPTLDKNTDTFGTMAATLADFKGKFGSGGWNSYSEGNSGMDPVEPDLGPPVDGFTSIKAGVKSGQTSYSEGGTGGLAPVEPDLGPPVDGFVSSAQAGAYNAALASAKATTKAATKSGTVAISDGTGNPSTGGGPTTGKVGLMK